jgi:hypothetical protein
VSFVPISHFVWLFLFLFFFFFLQQWSVSCREGMPFDARRLRDVNGGNMEMMGNTRGAPILVAVLFSAAAYFLGDACTWQNDTHASKSCSLTKANVKRIRYTNVSTAFSV